MKFLPSLLFFSLLCGIFTFTPLTEAKVFRNSYVSFQLPPNWRCNIEGTEWSCFSELNRKGKEAVIILTAKEAGPADNLKTYMDILKKTRKIPSVKHKPLRSKVQYVKQYRLGEKTWVDSLHLNSEVEAYYTRYMATVHNGLAVVVTFSAHRAYYSFYAEAFRMAIQSLRVVAPKNVLSAMPRPKANAQDRAVNRPLGQGGVGIISEDESEFASPTSSEGMSTKKRMAYLLILASILGTAYYYIKTKKK